jgi:hypothetical protein
MRKSVALLDALVSPVAALTTVACVESMTVAICVRSIPLSVVLTSIGGVAPITQIGCPTSAAVKWNFPSSSTMALLPFVIVQVETTPRRRTAFAVEMGS